MSSSSSNFSSATTPLPSCDAWANISIGAAGAASLTNSVQVASVSRLYTGAYGVTFSNPSRFGGGYYGLLMTPEFCDETSYGTVSHLFSDYGNGNAYLNFVAGRSAGFGFNTVQFHTPFGPAGGTAIAADYTANTIRINIAAFSFSNDGRTGAANGGVTGGTYEYLPGGKGYGISGATYYSAIPSLLSQRTATAYGTIVVAPTKGNSTCAYIENAFNVKGVSADYGVFDITFVKPMNTENYCVVLTGEYENVVTSINTSGGMEEPSILAVRAGPSNKYKTKSGFRVECLRQVTSGANQNSWSRQSYLSTNSKTERIHFMVFGGATYGQP